MSPDPSKSRRITVNKKPAYAPLKLDYLRTFLVLVETQSFTETGSIVGRSQSTISGQIKYIEQALDVELFHRTRDAVVPTDAGKRLVDYARRLLILEQEAAQVVSEREPCGPVRIGTQDHFASLQLPKILGAFTTAYPKVDIEVVCNTGCRVLEDLHHQKVDLVLLRQPQGTASCGVTLWTERLVWVAAPHFDLHTKMQIPLVIYSEGCFYRDVVFRSLEKAGLHSRVVYTASNSVGVHAAVFEGAGITALSQGTVPDSLRIIDSAGILPALPDMNVTLHMSHTPSSAVRKLGDFLQDFFRNR